MAVVQPQRMEDHVKHKRDSQQSRVYKWEKKFFLKKYNSEFTTLDRIQTFLDGVRSDINMKTPIEVVHSRKDSRRAFAYHRTKKIALPCRCMTRADALHELSHHVVDFQMPSDPMHASHGPEFVSVYSALVHWYMKVPEHVIFEHIDKCKVKHDQSTFDHYLNTLRNYHD